MGLECPQWFDEDARTAWREVLTEMERRGAKVLSTDSARAALAAYCREHIHWSFQARLLAEYDSMLASDRPGRVLSSILADIKKDTQETWTKANALGAIFSLSPADRIRIHNIPSASIPRSRPLGRSAGRGGAQA